METQPSQPQPTPRGGGMVGQGRPGPNWRERLSAPWRALPDLLVIGAQKSGTTSLHEFLGRHPEIRMSRIKECQVLWREGWSLSGYRAYFPLRARCRAAGVRCVGESTPYYLFHPAAPASVGRLDSAVQKEGRTLKAIAILRDPVERAWSQYRHERRLGTEPLAFADAIGREGLRLHGGPDGDPHAYRHHSYCARGEYAPQLERWFAALGRDRVLVLEFREMLAMDASLRERLRGFLGLRSPFEGAMPGLNAGAGEPMPDEVRSLLRGRFDASDRALAELLGRRPAWMEAEPTERRR